ncbi:unnamed protein product [Jaminaea pallidilutea]
MVDGSQARTMPSSHQGNALTISWATLPTSALRDHGVSCSAEIQFDSHPFASLYPPQPVPTLSIRKQ